MTNFLPNCPICTRRKFLAQFAAGVGAFSAAGAFAEELVRTPPQTEGPFYPDKLPLDTDNDLLVINDRITPGVGEITHLTGRILDARGEPVRNAVVEIWQCDNTGTYIHTADASRREHDTNFQGFGRFLTGRSGEYYFRTIKPVPYVPRTPHIHFKIKGRGMEPFITQCYIKDHPGNAKDGIFNNVGDAKAKAAVEVEFKPIPKSRIGELAAKFDVVLGFTPEG